MRDRKRIRLIIQTLLLLLISLAVLLLLMSMMVQNPPLKELMKYDQLNASANAVSGNELYSQKLLVAEHFKNAALLEWQEQDARWLPFRNYNEARRMMLIAISIVEEVSPPTAPPAEAIFTVTPHLLRSNDHHLKRIPEK